MARRLLGEHFKQQGGVPKVAYENQASAEHAAIMHDKRVAYHCSFCGLWHVGGTADRSEERARLRQTGDA